jgi:hypothetical protein
VPDQLNRGIPPATVAHWAGNSVPALPATYVNVIDNEQTLRGLPDRMYDERDGTASPPQDPNGATPSSS